MGDTSTIAGFALASFILIIIPGPSVLGLGTKLAITGRHD